MIVLIFSSQHGYSSLEEASASRHGRQPVDLCHKPSPPRRRRKNSHAKTCVFTRRYITGLQRYASSTRLLCSHLSLDGTNAQAWFTRRIPVARTFRPVPKGRQRKGGGAVALSGLNHFVILSHGLAALTPSGLIWRYIAWFAPITLVFSDLRLRVPITPRSGRGTGAMRSRCPLQMQHHLKAPPQHWVGGRSRRPTRLR